MSTQNTAALHQSLLVLNRFASTIEIATRLQPSKAHATRGGVGGIRTWKFSTRKLRCQQSFSTIALRQRTQRQTLRSEYEFVLRIPPGNSREHSRARTTCGKVCLSVSAQLSVEAEHAYAAEQHRPCARLRHDFELQAVSSEHKRTAQSRSEIFVAEIGGGKWSTADIAETIKLDQRVNSACYRVTIVVVAAAKEIELKGAGCACFCEIEQAGDLVGTVVDRAQVKLHLGKIGIIAPIPIQIEIVVGERANAICARRNETAIIECNPSDCSIA